MSLPTALSSAVATDFWLRSEAESEEQAGAPERLQEPPRRGLCRDLPWPNRLLLTSGALLVLGGLVSILAPALASRVASAVRPYTAEGKQELCVTRLHSVALALQMYAQDNEGRFPPLDYRDARKQGATWVSLLKGRGAEGDWNCPEAAPVPQEQAPWVSSYVMNPVLATSRQAEMDEAAASLMLADGGTRHDVSLLPPFPSWPSFEEVKSSDGRIGGSTPGSFDATTCNVAFRHSGKTPVVYADGHAGTLAVARWPLDANLWGGSAVLRRSRDRLAARNPHSIELFRRLQTNQMRGAAAYLKAHRARLRPVSREMLALWRLNSGEHTSNSLEEAGWNLARAWQMAGDASWMAQLNREQTLRCREQVQKLKSDPWESREVSGQPTLLCAAPATWGVQDEREGRYRRLYMRSPLPSVYAVLEVGARDRYVTPRPIDWSGSEKDLRKRYGREGYRRRNLGTAILAGNTASVWEYEVQKPGGPRLRKRYVGYTDGWTSYIAGCTAPDRDWALWMPVLSQFLDSAQTA